MSEKTPEGFKVSNDEKIKREFTSFGRKDSPNVLPNNVNSR